MFDLPPGIWIKVVKERLRELVIDDDLAIGDKQAAERLTRQWLAEPDDELAAALAQSQHKQAR